MKTSSYWNQEKQEAFDNPYQYKEQSLFLKEMKDVLKNLYETYNKFNMEFSNEDNQSLRKAVWMIHIDTVGLLEDCLFLLENKKHRLVGPAFRQILERLDMASLFTLKPKLLTEWYDKNYSPKHSEYRNTITDPEQKETLRNKYQRLSKWSHTAYFNLKFSFNLGRDSLLWHDNYCSGKSLYNVHTVSLYFTELAHLTNLFEEKSQEFLSLDERRGRMEGE